MLLLAALLVAPAAPAFAQSQPAEQGQPSGRTSGLQLPRFVSLKSDRVNLRKGPGVEYPAAWVYRRVGLPLEVMQEFEGWRQVRDADGAVGWVLQSMLSGRRTALVLPWDVKEGQPAPNVGLREDDRDAAKLIATVEAGVIANIRSCDGRWCFVAIGEFKGYIEQHKLWGVYSGEAIR